MVGRAVPWETPVSRDGPHGPLEIGTTWQVVSNSTLATKACSVMKKPPKDRRKGESSTWPLKEVTKCGALRHRNEAEGIPLGVPETKHRPPGFAQVVGAAGHSCGEELSWTGQVQAEVRPRPKGRDLARAGCFDGHHHDREGRPFKGLTRAHVLHDLIG